MKVLLQKNNGFTLIELMIVVAILGILAAIGLTNFQKYQCKSKQSEAKTHLSSIRTLQEAFRAENDTYTTVLSSLGYSASGDTRYSLVVSSASANSFVITANGVVGDVTGDVWTMTENGTLNNDTNSCD